MSAVLAGCFFACSLMIWWNVYQIIKDKVVSGVSLIPTFVFLATNFIQTGYFLALGDLPNGIASASMALANVVWLGLALRYRTRGTDILT